MTVRLFRAISICVGRVVLAAGLVCLAGVAVAGPAWAEVGAGASPTSQAIAADAQFLEYAPPPAQPGVVCLVDSGVDPNPDTTPALVGAEGANPSWGSSDGLAEVQQRVDGHPNGHGTEMAMLMAAPQNGWGMVGIAPTAVRVYSIRVLPPGGTTFSLAGYSYALNRCEVLRGTSQPGMTVVNLSLGGTETPTTDELRFMQDAVETARQRGLNVVAAAGNGGTVSFPASYPPVVAVGAGDAAAGGIGVLCDFSKSKGLDIIAPGCNSAAGGIAQAFEDDGTPAFGFGTSQAAAITSSVLAAMRAYAPTLSILDAESCLTRTEKDSGSLDAAGAFRACGLARVVDAGLAVARSTSSGQSGGVTTEGSVATLGPHEPPVVAPLATPRLAGLHLRHGKLLVRVLNRPRGASINVELMSKRGPRLMVIARTLRSSRVTFYTRWARSVRVRFVLPGAPGRASAWILRTIQ